MELGVDRVLIANPDVYFSDACVRRIDRIMTENPDAAVVAPTQLVNGSPLVWRLPTDLQDVLSASLFISKCFRRFMPYYPAGWFAGKSKVEVDAVAGSLLLVDVRKMDAVGMYDERVFLFYEELLLGWKFKTAGWKTLLAVDESYDHFHSVSIKKSYKSLVSQKKLLLRSKLYFIRAYRSFSPLALLFTRAFFQLTLAEIWVLSVARTLAKR
jgi:GT2 family glycosyltransferase